MYLSCHGNKRADTVLAEFKQAVNSYDLPSIVHRDRGIENVRVAQYMFNHQQCPPPDPWTAILYDTLSSASLPRSSCSGLAISVT